MSDKLKIHQLRDQIRTLDLRYFQNSAIKLNWDHINKLDDVKSLEEVIKQLKINTYLWGQS